jgi:hypothetical protein
MQTTAIWPSSSFNRGEIRCSHPITLTGRMAPPFGFCDPQLGPSSWPLFGHEAPFGRTVSSEQEKQKRARHIRVSNGIKKGAGIKITQEEAYVELLETRLSEAPVYSLGTVMLQSFSYRSERAPLKLDHSLTTKLHVRRTGKRPSWKPVNKLSTAPSSSDSQKQPKAPQLRSPGPFRQLLNL